MSRRKPLPTKECQVHEINFWDKYDECPYCKTKRLEVEEAQAEQEIRAAAAKAQQKGTKRLGTGKDKVV